MKIMETSNALLLEMAKRVPELLVLCLLVYFILKQNSKSQGESRTEFMNTMRQINEENLAAREQSREVIKDNTIASKENIIALNALTLAVESLRRETQIYGLKATRK